MAKRTMLLRGLILSVSLILSLLTTACGPPQGQTVPSSSDNRGVDLPPLRPVKGNPKLDSVLSQLISAEKRGEAESFARQRSLQLVDAKVRVSIEAEPGQLDMAANVTAMVGTVEIISQRLNHVQAVVPITSLTTLAEEKSIKFIGAPVTPTPG